MPFGLTLENLILFLCEESFVSVVQKEKLFFQSSNQHLFPSMVIHLLHKKKFATWHLENELFCDYILRKCIFKILSLVCQNELLLLSFHPQNIHTVFFKLCLHGTLILRSHFLKIIDSKLFHFFVDRCLTLSQEVNPMCWGWVSYPQNKWDMKGEIHLSFKFEKDCRLNVVIWLCSSIYIMDFG